MFAEIITIGDEMVLDPQNSAFPVPAQRKIGGLTIQETKLINYPYFVDIRPDGMNGDSSMLSGLNQVTMNWASPITVDAEKNKDRTVTRLLESSPDSWLSADTNIQPDFGAYGEMGFAPGTEKGRQLLGVAVEGRFTSYFAGKPSPILAEALKKKEEQQKAAAQAKDNTDEPEKDDLVVARQIDKSPESARIILFSSNSFVNDRIISIGSSVMRSNYLGPIQLITNSVDWSLEDRGLLSIRGRGNFARTLHPMARETRIFWEYLNYGLALLGLLLVWMSQKAMRKRATHHYLAILQ